jgi:hypothetical protein
MENPIFISFLLYVHLVGPDVEIIDDEVNKQLQLYQMLYDVRFIYPEHRVSSERGNLKIYAHLLHIVSKEYYYDVYNHKSNEIPITTCPTGGSCTYGFAKGKPFVTATISKCRTVDFSLSMNIHYPIYGSYKNVSFREQKLYQNSSIIQPMMHTTKGEDSPTNSNEDEQ